jgi:site-specific DNA-methyltransferase (adenine-specific)
MLNIKDITNTIIQGDCLEVMKQMPDNCVDLILTDPPYGIGIDGQKACSCKNPKHNRKEHDFKGWDKAIPPKEYFEEMFRVSRNQIIWGGNYFVEHLTEGHKGWIVWDKGQHGLTMSDCELAYSSFDFVTRIIVMNRAELLRDGTKHPTQKPYRLFKQIITKHSSENQIILDPFLGSGTTAVACELMNRNYIGIEISPEYCEIARKRVQEAKDSMGLFK